ncbi:MAG: TIGR02221 family CRISPR-associated protein [Burkholderiales bacterium]
MTTHTLVSFLGKGREKTETGYRCATYRFADGQEQETPFFGMALARHIKPDRLLFLGTNGSMWDALTEHLSHEGNEELRMALIDAVIQKTVDQALLDMVQKAVESLFDIPISLRLIPYGREDQDQREILSVIAASVPRGKVSFDLTHAFRHLGMLGLVSAFFMERIGKIDIQGLFYGALDMTADGITPVLRLDGLMGIQRWIDALDRFDAAGDYGVFASLLIQDGVPEDKARCLEEAAFHERTFNLMDAARKLATFAPVLDSPLPGASGLFQSKIKERLAWVNEPSLAERQRKLAYIYLKRSDYVRAAVLGWEALITRECESRDLDPQKYNEGRKLAEEALDIDIKSGDVPDGRREAYKMLKTLRNALAHGNPPKDRKYRHTLQSAKTLRQELESAFKRLIG